MPNESGRNAHGVKEYPPDEVLKASLLRYAQSRYTREEKKSALQKEHNLSIQNTKLAELEKKFDIPSVRKRIPAELAKQAVLDEVDKGGWEGSQHNGPDYIQTKLANRLVLSQNLHLPDPAWHWQTMPEQPRQGNSA